MTGLRESLAERIAPPNGSRSELEALTERIGQLADRIEKHDPAVAKADRYRRLFVALAVLTVALIVAFSVCLYLHGGFTNTTPSHNTEAAALHFAMSAAASE